MDFKKLVFNPHKSGTFPCAFTINQSYLENINISKCQTYHPTNNKNILCIYFVFPDILSILKTLVKKLGFNWTPPPCLDHFPTFTVFLLKAFLTSLVHRRNVGNKPMMPGRSPPQRQGSTPRSTTTGTSPAWSPSKKETMSASNSAPETTRNVGAERG